ncbi:MAG: energy-coupling factor transporter ATPase [Clostridia bacterium]|nr:energy-coupling factor transporter ATPase [Clostridia bacterium]
MTKVELQNVGFVYGEKGVHPVRALQGISLTLDEGGVIGLIGHTGSGKSTLVQLLNGLLRPTEGRVLLDGKDLWENPSKIREIRFRVGLVMQYAEYQLFDETVRSDIAFGPKNMGLSGEELDEAVRRGASFAGLEESLLDKSPFDLSGGQKRRAALAGVIAMSPEVLILDEPAAGLDPRSRREILTRIRDYQRETGSLVIIVSHSMEDMAKYCDRILVMSEGTIVLDGNRSEVFSEAGMLESMGLDVPEVTKLASELKKRGLDIGKDVYTVDYAVEKILEKLKQE